MTDFLKQLVIMVVVAIVYAIVFVLTYTGVTALADKLRAKADAWKSGFEE